MINEEILKYITERKKVGVDDENILKELTNNGWTYDDVDEAFEEINKDNKKGWMNIKIFTPSKKFSTIWKITQVIILWIICNLTFGLKPDYDIFSSIIALIIISIFVFRENLYKLLDKKMSKN
ncbi:MAG: hypothetical protein WC827_04645 [Candidatus Paceibacterota bacterium]|jgi:hypothetical protein